MAFLNRRGFIVACAAGSLPAFLQSCAVGGGDEGKPRRSATASRITTYITANEDFYLIAVDPAFRPRFGPGDVDGRWALEIVTRSGTKHHLQYADLRRMAARRMHYTLECIGNPPGGPLIGNAIWGGVPLRDVLLAIDPAGPSARATVMFEGLDDFYSSSPWGVATDVDAFLALDMNAEPLPPEHGFPARVLLPDLYGKKQPRWLRRIRLLDDEEPTSYWEKRLWRAGPVKTTSRIDPLPEAMEPFQRIELTGMAFAGARGILSVEVSLDGGGSWQRCETTTGSRRHAWSLWRYTWPVETAGRYEVMVRAMDGEGSMQIAKQSGAFPSGATGLHTVLAEIR